MFFYCFLADIIIYDEEQDKHVHITLGEALRAATHGAANVNAPGQNGPVDGFFGVTTADGVQDKAAKAHGQGKGEVVPNAIADILLKVAAGVWLPLEIIIARPFIEHLMMSAVLAVAGRDTGATLFGPADMQISANTSVKTIEGYAYLSLP